MLLEEHIAEDDLELYAMNRMAEDDRALVEEHLIFCEHCQDQLRQFDDFLRAIRIAAPRLEAEERSRESRWRHWLGRFRDSIGSVYAAPALAAAALALVLIPAPETRIAPVHALTLESMRGGPADGIVTAPAGSRLHLTMDTRGLPELPVYRIHLVDSRGGMVWEGESKPAPSGLAVTTSRAIAAGLYWVRILGAGPDPLREFGVRAVEPAAAATPRTEPGQRPAP